MKEKSAAHDLFIQEEENEKTNPQLEYEPKIKICYPKALKGILIAIPIAIALWCMIISLFIVIF